MNERYYFAIEVGRQKCRKRGLIMIFCANISRSVCAPFESRRAVNTKRYDMLTVSYQSLHSFELD